MGVHWLLAAKISINQPPGQRLQRVIESINHTLTSDLEFSIHLDSRQIWANNRQAIAHGSLKQDLAIPCILRVPLLITRSLSAH